MSTAAREISIQMGQPIRTYEFTRGPLKFYYTSADRPTTLGVLTFDPIPVFDSGVRFTGQASADPLTITISSSSPISQMFRGVPPSDEVSVVVRDTHYGELDYQVVWVGSILNTRWPAIDSCELTCWSIASSMDKPGLRMTWQRGCPHSLYDGNCKVDASVYKVPGTILDSSGLIVHVSTAGLLAPGWFSGGFLDWTLPSGVIERRGIREHSDTSLVILGGVYGLEVGTAVNLYPGCIRTTAICSGKFNNLDNYGGAPFLPGTSPFNGNPVF